VERSGGLSLDVFTKNTAPPGVVGGLLNSIVGSVMMTGIGLALGAPVGILAGTYLAEYGANSKLASVVRFINDILLSAPSIIVGLFVYELLVVPVGHFLRACRRLSHSQCWARRSWFRTTEDMLKPCSHTLREAPRRSACRVRWSSGMSPHVIGSRPDTASVERSAPVQQASAVHCELAGRFR